MRTWQSEHKNQVFTAALGGCGSVSMVGSQQTEWAGFSLLPPLCLMLDRHARLTIFLLCNFSYFVKMFVLLLFFSISGTSPVFGIRTFLCGEMPQHPSPPRVFGLMCNRSIVEKIGHTHFCTFSFYRLLL